MSLFEELYQYILKNCVHVRLTNYRFFKLDTTAEPFVLLILGIFAGFFLASVAVVYQKRFLGSFVIRLQKKNAYTEDTAQSLADLGLSKNIFIRKSLESPGSVIRKMVRILSPTEKSGEVTEEKEGKTEEKKTKKAKLSLKERIDFSTAKFYIPEELRYRAEFRFRKRGNAVLTVAVAFILCCVFAFVFILFLPDLIRLADNTLGLFM